MKPPKQPPNTQDKSVDDILKDFGVQAIQAKDGETVWNAHYKYKQDLLQLLLSALPEKEREWKQRTFNAGEIVGRNNAIDQSVSEIKRLFNGGL